MDKKVIKVKKWKKGEKSEIYRKFFVKLTEIDRNCDFMMQKWWQKYVVVVYDKLNIQFAFFVIPM